jgi:hypothetical protein
MQVQICKLKFVSNHKGQICMQIQGGIFKFESAGSSL